MRKLRGGNVPIGKSVGPLFFSLRVPHITADDALNLQPKNSKNQKKKHTKKKREHKKQNIASLFKISIKFSLKTANLKIFHTQIFNLTF